MTFIRLTLPITPICFLAFLFTACQTSAPRAERLWWQKQPLQDERAFFDWALGGPQSPHDGYPKPKDFVGWYGIVKDCRDVKVTVPSANRRDQPITQALITLDHRYADQANVYRGIGDHLAVQTVSLFGDGEFLAVAKSCGDAANGGIWKGDLVRAYGDLRRKDERDHWIIETVYVRSWPRDQYELAPLAARYEKGRMLRQAPMNWALLDFDREVVSTAVPLDNEIKPFLFLKMKHADTRMRAALALAEYGGADAIEVLGRWQKKDARMKSVLKRARREIGPIWRPQAADPYWASGAEPEFYRMRNVKD